jgi:hypothetical protein
VTHNYASNPPRVKPVLFPGQKSLSLPKPRSPGLISENERDFGNSVATAQVRIRLIANNPILLLLHREVGEQVGVRWCQG